MQQPIAGLAALTAPRTDDDGVPVGRQVVAAGGRSASGERRVRYAQVPETCTRDQSRCSLPPPLPRPRARRGSPPAARRPCQTPGWGGVGWAKWQAEDPARAPPTRARPPPARTHVVASGAPPPGGGYTATACSIACTAGVAKAVCGCGAADMAPTKSAAARRVCDERGPVRCGLWAAHAVAASTPPSRRHPLPACPACSPDETIRHQCPMGNGRQPSARTGLGIGGGRAART